MSRQVAIDFDAAAAAAARERALDQVEGGSASWQEEAIVVLRRIAREKSELTTDDLWRALARPDDLEPRAAGALMRRAVREKLVERTDRTRKSERVACHRRDVRVWRSLVHGG
jgi:hypothetical protein